jgi:DNA-binding transcriptional regulator YhcF (GntR family)
MMWAQNDVQDYLRRRLITDLHLGRLKPRDRAPSLRIVAAELGVGIRAVSRAYAALEKEGLVFIRGRSGVYVAASSFEPELTEPQSWYSSILTDAWRRRIPLPALPDLLQQFVSRRLRCACVESTEDHMTAFCAELDHDFGLDTVAVDLLIPGDGHAQDTEKIDSAVADTDFVVTTAFHASEVRVAAQRHKKPMVIISVNETLVHAIEARLREGPATILGADPRFVERVDRCLTTAFQSSGTLRVVHLTDYLLNPHEFEHHLLMPTRAAQKMMEAPEYHLLPDAIPFISLDAAREITRCMIAVQGESIAAALQPA